MRTVGLVAVDRRLPPLTRNQPLPLARQSLHDRPAGAELLFQRLEAAIPKGARRIVLDEHGSRLSTLQLADRLRSWMSQGNDAVLLIGGPDGLAPELKASADETLRLSDLTLPHAMARVLLAEALYRAWSVVIGHPYHRE